MEVNSEINQPGRFEDLKHITIEQLTPPYVNEIHKRLRKSMLAMSNLSIPYDNKIVKRKDALITRIKQIEYSLELDYDNAKYGKTEPGTVYDNKVIKFPYTFEVLAIPIKNRTGRSIIISGVNYSTSINNLSYFTADKFEHGYSWLHKNGTHLHARIRYRRNRKSIIGRR
jgi:hypothetical protein